MLERPTNWFRTGRGNDQVLVRKPGSCTARPAGGKCVPGSGTGGCGQRVGSGQTCPIGQGDRVVLASRCWWRCSCRHGSQRRHTSGMQTGVGRLDGAIKGNPVGCSSEELSARSRGGLLHHGHGYVGGLAICRDFGRSDESRVRRDGVRRREQQHGEHNIQDRRRRNQRINKPCTVGDRWVCRQEHRVGRQRVQ